MNDTTVIEWIKNPYPIDDINHPVINAIAVYGKDFQKLFLRLNVPKKFYVYMLTITLDPSKYPNTDGVIQDVEKYIENLQFRSPLQLDELAYVQETHKNGRPHWHVCLRSTTPLKSNLFKHASKKFGKVQLKAQVKGVNTTEMYKYLSKENEIKKIIIGGKVVVS